MKNRASKHLLTLASAGFCLICGPSAAHVTLEYQVANAGSYYKANFKVGHGCGNSPTRQLVVGIPAGVQSARPMPKPGWALDTSDPARISWTAKTKDDWLPANFYDEFALQAKLPATAGMLYWPVTQICEQGSNEWTQLPAPGQALSELKSPAAALEVLPLAGGGGHNH